MNDCKVCVHYECCCGWTSKEVIDSIEEAVEEGICYECKYFEQQKIGKWISASTKPGVQIGMKCSLCGARIKYSEFFNGNHNYCYKCGARMIKDEQSKNL